MCDPCFFSANERIESFWSGFIRSAQQGGAMVRRPGVHIQENIQVIIRQEINAGNTLEQALYNAGKCVCLLIINDVPTQTPLLED